MKSQCRGSQLKMGGALRIVLCLSSAARLDHSWCAQFSFCNVRAVYIGLWLAYIGL